MNQRRSLSSIPSRSRGCEAQQVQAVVDRVGRLALLDAQGRVRDERLEPVRTSRRPRVISSSTIASWAPSCQPVHFSSSSSLLGLVTLFFRDDAQHQLANGALAGALLAADDEGEVDLVLGTLDEVGQVVEHGLTLALVGHDVGHVLQEPRHVAGRGEPARAPDVVALAVGHLGALGQVGQRLELADEVAAVPDLVEDVAIDQVVVQGAPLLGPVALQVMTADEHRGCP